MSKPSLCFSQNCEISNKQLTEEFWNTFAKQIAKCFETKDAKEGIAAFLEKRKPNWD